MQQDGTPCIALGMGWLQQSMEWGRRFPLLMSYSTMQKGPHNGQAISEALHSLQPEDGGEKATLVVQIPGLPSRRVSHRVSCCICRALLFFLVLAAKRHPTSWVA
jgi:hypothetical protein